MNCKKIENYLLYLHNLSKNITNLHIIMLFCPNPFVIMIFFGTAGIGWIIYSAITIHNCTGFTFGCTGNVNNLSIVGITLSCFVICVVMPFTIAFRLRDQVLKENEHDDDREPLLGANLEEGVNNDSLSVD